MKRPVSKLSEKGLMGVLAAFWFALGVYSMGNDVLLGMMMVFNGIVFAYYGFICRACNNKVRILLYVFVGLNIILTFTDQVGVWDWIVLALYAALCGFMIYNDVKHKGVC